jgi:predicted alpha/beta-fold hydrolase
MSVQSSTPSSDLVFEFRTTPLLRNRHVQTMLGSLWRGPRPVLESVEREVGLPDGDRLVLHESAPPGWQAGHPIAILVHGLGGTHASGYMERTTALLLKRGIQVYRMDLRGCGRGMHLARRTYNAGRSGDLREALAAVHCRYPSSPLLLIGFSLGGNLVLKLAGEAADRPVPRLERVAAVNPPIDLEGSAALLALRRNRPYEMYFIRSLLRQIRERQRLFPDLEPVRFPRYTTMRIFDDLHTARDGGFADAVDYYRKSGALPLIPLIPVPALLLTARDDPFVAVEPFESLRVPTHIEVQIAERGGHLGFLAWDSGRFVRWAEHRVVQWVTRVD